MLPQAEVTLKLIFPFPHALLSGIAVICGAQAAEFEPVYIESESGLVEGKYELQFFDDADNDGNADQGKREFIVSMSVPCEK